MPLTLFRRAYAALHRWAEAGWAGPAVGTWNLLQGAAVPGPTDGLLAPLALADPPRAFPLAGWATAGAVVGGCIAYAVGVTAFDSVGVRLLDWVGVTRAAVEAKRALFVDHGWWVIALSSLTPMPSKIVCLAAGAFGVPPVVFATALLVGRGARFVVVAGLCSIVGRRLARDAALAADAEATAER
ncbi:MAG TPA: VTT domain-containing protein [Gemmatimonadaceae bacterium]|nr:VTT domain-containing protein [Gemmatimonadaceae bacterium]